MRLFCYLYNPICNIKQYIYKTNYALGHHSRTYNNIFVGIGSTCIQQARLAQSVEYQTSKLRAVGSSPAVIKNFSFLYFVANVKWHSDPWPTVTSQPIRLSTNFMTLILSLTFTDYEWFPWSICNGCGMPAGNAYHSGHLVPSPFWGLACALIVETSFPDTTPIK